MENYSLSILKQIGHRLLDELVALEGNAKPIFKGEKARSRVYTRIQKKLRENYHSHFSMMKSEQEIIDVNNRLRKMILKKQKIIKKYSHNKFAPNLQEIQKQVGALNAL